MVKTSSGFNSGQFDYLDVDYDANIDGNLTVGGIITGSISGAITTTSQHFVATDANNQFRADSSTYDLKSTNSLNPVFRFKASDDTTTNVTIATGYANFTTLTGESVLIQSGDNASSIVGPASIRTLGGMCITKNAVVGGNLAVLGAITAASTTISGAFASGFFVATNTSGVNLTCNSTDDTNGTVGVGSISTLGGIYIGRKAHVTTDLTVGGTLNVTGVTTLSSSLNVTRTTALSAGASAFTVTSNESSAEYPTVLQNNTTSSSILLGMFTPSNTSFVSFAFGKQRGAGTSFLFRYFCPTGTVTLSQFGLSNGIDILSTNQVNIKAAITSTTTTTGSLVVTGGQGISGALNVGGNTNVGGNIVCTGSITGASIIGPIGGTAASFTATNASGVNLTCTSVDVATSSPGVGSICTPGGINAQKNIYIGTTAEIVGTITCATITSSGVYTASAATGTTLAISSTTDSSAVGTGSAILLGGLSVAKNGYFGGNIVCTGSITGASIIGPIGGTAAAFTATNTTGTNYFANSTTDATSISTGSVQLLGGLSVQKQVWIGTSLNVASNITVSGNTTTASLNVSGTSILNILQATGTTTLDITTASTLNVVSGTGNTFNVLSPAVSLSSVTGSAVFAGGVGIGEALFVGTRILSPTITSTAATGVGLIVTSTENSFSTITGCATFGGGIGVVGNIITTGQIYTTEKVQIQNPVLGNVFYVSTLAPTISPATGAAVIMGGLGVGMDIRCGGNLYNQNILLYSSGSWTPTFGFRDGIPTPTLGINSSQGQWTRVGNMVTVSYYCNFNQSPPTGTAGVGRFVIDNIPFFPEVSVNGANAPSSGMNPDDSELTGLQKSLFSSVETFERVAGKRDIRFYNYFGAYWVVNGFGADSQRVNGVFTFITADILPRS